MASLSAAGTSICAARNTAARIDQILQHLQLQRRAARQVAAIGKDLSRQLAFEALEHSCQARLEPAEHVMPAIRPLSARTRPAPATSQEAVRARWRSWAARLASICRRSGSS